MGYLASSLEQAGHEADLQSYNGETDIDGILKKLLEADIASLSLTYQAKAKEYLHLATVIKKHASDISIIAGGHYATCAARDILIHHPEIDIIVLHEGEKTIVELAELYEHQNRSLESVAGIAYRQDDDVFVTSPRRKIEDLDSLPFPRRNNKAYILAGVPTAYLLGSRGCLNSCTYCCISTIHNYAPGKRFRQRKPEQIAREMAELYNQRGVRHFVFHDDNFLVPRLDQNLSRLEELEREIHRNDLKDIGLTIKCCPSEVEESLFAKLKEMGLVRVFLGIESSCDKVVFKLKRRQTLEQSENAIAICRVLGISVQFNIMVFNPFADFSSIRDDMVFMEKYIGHPLNFCRTELFAGTPLEKEMIEQKRARGNYLSRVYSMATPAVDRASRFFTRLFYDRCWSQSSLMLMSGGMDHLSAVLNQHYGKFETRIFRKRIRDYVIRVNEDSIAMLKEMVALFENEAEFPNPQLVERLRTLAERERCSREDLLQLGENIREDLSHFVHTRLGIEPADGIGYEIKGKRSNLAKHAMAVVLALSVSGTSSCISLLGGGVEEYAPPPLEDTYASFKSSHESSWFEEHANDSTAKRVETNQNTYLIWRETATDDFNKSTRDSVIMQVLKKPEHLIPDLAIITVAFHKIVQDNLVGYHLSFSISSDEGFYFYDRASVKINNEITELDGKAGSMQVSAGQFNTYLVCNPDPLMGKEIKENSKIVVRTYIRQKDYLDIDIPSEFISLVLSVL